MKKIISVGAFAEVALTAAKTETETYSEDLKIWHLENNFNLMQFNFNFAIDQ